MNIDKSILNRYAWYEDNSGKIIDGTISAETAVLKYGATTYHSRFPLQVSEEVSRVSVENGSIRFNSMYTIRTNIGADQDLILALVNSGDYNLAEAINLLTTCCERCSNALAYKYLNGADGYPEDSDEYKNLGTVCEFCKDDENDENTI